MARLKLSLLGPFMATLDGAPLAGLRSGKSRALLAYLAGEAGRPHQRTALATLLWGEHPNDAARLSLRVALSSLREALAPLDPGQDHPALLEITHQSVQLNLEPERCWVDAVEFDARLTACAAHPHHTIARCPSCIQNLEEAVALYRGDFLADLAPTDCVDFEEWQVLCQERYHRQAIEALEQITQHYLGVGNYAAAQRYTRQLLAMEPWHERAHRQLMQALALDGQRGAALVQFDNCRRVLERELGAEPEAETTALWASIRDGTFEGPVGVEVPMPLTPFVGRTTELAHISAMLADPACRLVILVGPGGIGKTRLALAAAARQKGLFRDEICFVQTPAASTPEGLDLALAEALHLTVGGLDSAPKARLLGYLRSKELLLVLDDLQPQPALAAWIVDLLQRAPGVRILATARQRLNVRGECVLHLVGLEFPTTAADPCIHEPETTRCCDAISLFVQNVQRLQPGFTLTDADLLHIMHICQMVEGMPLAIELAASWIPTLSCAEIAQEIPRDLGFLATTMQDMPERHRSLRAVFAQSWELLSSSEQAALGRLSVLQRGFDRASANAVAGAGLPLLASLTDKALLRRDRCPPGPLRASSSAADQGNDAGACYSLHELVRQYAAERLAGQPGEPAATQERHSRHFLAFLAKRQAALMGAGQPEALAQIAQQSENWRAAWYWAVEHESWPELQSALPSLFLFCYMRSWFYEGETAIRFLGDTLANRGDASTEALFGQALAGQAWFAFLIGQAEQAQTLLNRSLALLRAANARTALAFALTYRGAMALHQGDILSARTACAESLAIYEAVEDHYGIAVTCNILGRAAHQMGDYDEAQRQCQRNLEIARRLGNQWSMAFSLELLGRIALARADALTANEILAECLAIRRAMDDRRGVGLTLNLLGDAHLACGAHTEAECCYREALGIFQILGYQSGSENAQAGLASVSQANLQAAQSEREASASYFAIASDRQRPGGRTII